MKKAIYFLVFILFYACSQHKDKTPTFISIDLDNSEIIELGDIVDSITIINLETNKESLIGKVKKLVVYNNDFFILDSRQHALFRFDSEGKYICKIHCIGKGPGEYNRISDFCIDTSHNQIILLTDGRNLLVYSLEGDYENQTYLKDFVCHFLIHLDNYNLLLYSASNKNRFCFYDYKKKQIIRKVISSNDFMYKTGFAHLYSPFIQKDSTSYYFCDTYSYNIYIINSKDKIRAGSLDFGNYNYNLESIPLNEGKDVFKNKYFELISNGDYVMNIFYFLETTKYYLTSYFYNKSIETSVLDKMKGQNYLLEQYQFPQIKYYLNNSLYALFEPLTLEKYVPENLLFQNRIKDMNINDNPFLIIYNFK